MSLNDEFPIIENAIIIKTESKAKSLKTGFFSAIKLTLVKAQRNGLLQICSSRRVTGHLRAIKEHIVCSNIMAHLDEYKQCIQERTCFFFLIGLKYGRKQNTILNVDRQQRVKWTDGLRFCRVSHRAPFST